jgi:glycosyltransferase involved in cell wall biosynthesis
MPVYNGRGYLELSLPPLLRLLEQGEVLELIVADDGSTDGSGDWCAERGARVVPTPGRGGPGGARNLASREARGDIVWFVDADVVVHPDAIFPLRAAFEDPNVVAVFGSYDDTPPDPGFASGYMNLRHHYVHHEGAGEASTFWAGCGAVRRDVFLEVGGYDAVRYARPSIEDIELGYRLRATGGRIRLDPAMQGTHLKRWTLGGVVRTDIVCRALPWSRLLHASKDLPKDLNTGAAEQAKAVLAGLFVLSLPAAAIGLVPLVVPGLLYGIAIAVNLPLFRCFRRARGTVFALLALAFHQVHYVYSAAVFVYTWVESRLGAGSAALGADT